jgi:CRP-like cAMP-binding protein
MESVFHEKRSTDLERIRSRATRRHCRAGERLFSEGDEGDSIYFIDSGRVSIFIEKFSNREEIQTLGPGTCFGEMAVFLNDRRTASAAAVEDTVLLCLGRSEFLELLKTDHAIAQQIEGLLAKRNEELVLKEKLIDATGLSRKHLHVGIKGDPSLKESAMTRERHESVVDKVLPELLGKLEDLMLNRCAYRIVIGFNSGEIRVSSILDPFGEEYHPAERLLDDAYLDRHFPRVDYQRKVEIIRRLNETVQSDGFFAELPAYLQKAFGKYYASWQPVPPEGIARTISQLPQLRSIPNYYVRNTTISIVKDAIHMQFNCDGAHIVSSLDYRRFLDENL